MKKIILWLFMCVFLIVIPASAEDYRDSYLIFAPFFENGQNPWGKTKDDAAKFINSLNGFECNYIRTERGTTELVCRSDRKKYEGFYKIVIDFGFTDEYIRALEIQISHPELDEGMKIRASGAYLSDAEYVFRHKEGIQVSENSPAVYLSFNHIYSDDNVSTYTVFEFNDGSIYCNGELSKDYFEDEHVLVISISDKEWFYYSQTTERINPETGEKETVTIKYDVDEE